VRQVRIGIVLGTVAVVALGVAGTAVAKTVSPERYAKVLCTTLGAKDELVDGYAALPGDDSAIFQTQAVELVNELIADLKAGKAKLKKLTPDIERGKKTSKLFVRTLDDQVATLRAAVDTFAIADPNGVAFAADVAQLEVAVNLRETTTGDPFNEVTNQDLLEAFDEEPSCEEIVTVF
jgi:hypothetical protein